MNFLRASWWPLVALWALVTTVALWVRPLLPVDETRYVTVAWEMWARGDFLVPHLNGETYAHKPPLLFWLMQGGWALFGVNDWWPRLVAPLIGLLGIGLTARLARELWPVEGRVSAIVAWLLFASLFWMAFATLTQFDLLIVAATLIGMLGWWRMSARQGFSWLPGVAIGLGVLAKGPVILLHLLPVALLAPLWATRPARGWGRWYLWLLLSVLIGAAIGLAWALPAGFAGGEAYRHAIFWGQTADRVVDSFAHKQPWWWYLPMLPVLLLPWVFWPRVWRGLVGTGLSSTQSMRFLLTWILPVFIAFSLVSGKQIKYLLPLLPAFALLGGYVLSRTGVAGGRPLFAALTVALAGLLLAVLPLVIRPDNAYWLQAISPWWGVGLLVVAGVLLFFHTSDPLAAARVLAVASALIVITAHLGVVRMGAPAYDLHAFSERIERLQSDGHPVAHVGKYHGQFHFLGRLTQPVAVVEQWNGSAIAWAKAHPGGYLVVYRSDWAGLGAGALYSQPFRSTQDELTLWQAATWLQALQQAGINTEE